MNDVLDFIDQVHYSDQ